MKQQIYIVNNGIDFEKAVLAMVESCGFKCKLTPESGDQGVDAIAYVGNKKIAIQCKFYSENLVGNDAVQQVVAGKIFWDCDDAAVVSNTRFSKSAYELANKAKVQLLHYSQLKALIENQARAIREATVRSLTTYTWAYDHIERTDTRFVPGCDFVLESGDKRIAVSAYHSTVGIVRAIQAISAAASVLSCQDAWLVCDTPPIRVVNTYSQKAGVSIISADTYEKALQELDDYGSNFGGVEVSFRYGNYGVEPETTKPSKRHTQNEDGLFLVVRQLWRMYGDPENIMSAEARQELINRAGDTVIRRLKNNSRLRNRHSQLWMLLRFIAAYRTKLVLPDEIARMFRHRSKLAFGVTQSDIQPYRISTEAISPEKLWGILSEAARLIDAYDHPKQPQNT